MNNNFLTIDQKKGDPSTPHGKMTVYARVLVDVEKAHGESHNQLADIIRDGFLAAQGNYRDQNNLRDFLRQELGTSFDDEEGIKKFVEGLGGIEGALDPDKFKEKLEELEELEEFIPTPAKMVHFSSEEQILKEEGDVFFLGTFENSANANLAVNAATILYQAKYRETQILSVRSEVDSLITQLDVPTEEGRTPPVNKEELELDLAAVDLETALLKKFIPELIHGGVAQKLRSDAETHLKEYLSWYNHVEDVDRLIDLTQQDKLNEKRSSLIELYVKKISALRNEDFDHLTSIVQSIKLLEDELQA